MVERAAMERKTEATTWKSIKNWIITRCQKWPCILFGLTYRENKQWVVRVKLTSNSEQKYLEYSWHGKTIALTIYHENLKISLQENQEWAQLFKEQVTFN